MDESLAGKIQRLRREVRSLRASIADVERRLDRLARLAEAARQRQQPPPPPADVTHQPRHKVAAPLLYQRYFQAALASWDKGGE